MTKISNDYYLPNANAPKISETGDNSALGKDAFLQILITQLQNQDPTSPMDDKEFIAQMAQFSSLEQMQNMTKAMENLLASQQQSQLMNYTNFVGKEIKWHEITDKVDEKGQYIVEEGTGKITELKFVDGEPLFVLDSGKEITPGNISSVVASGEQSISTSNTVLANTFAEASELIGKMVQYTSGDQLIEQMIAAITKNGTGIEYILNNGDRLTKDQFELVSDEASSKTNSL
jgi:flagellar basal-body rod modification protein FlgD